MREREREKEREKGRKEEMKSKKRESLKSKRGELREDRSVVLNRGATAHQGAVIYCQGCLQFSI